MDKVKLAWVVGLLEGEGCFSKKNNRSRDVRVTCVSTDEDVIVKLHRYLGVGHVNGPYHKKPYHKRKPYYVLQISGKPAYDVLKLVHRHMGRRRFERISQLLEEYNAFQEKIYRIKDIRTGKISKVVNITEWCVKRHIPRHKVYRKYKGKWVQYKNWIRIE